MPRRSPVLENGYKQGKLTVLKYLGIKTKHSATYLVKCDCGEKFETTITKLNRKQKPIQSCGCLQRDKAKKALVERTRTHGMTKTKFFQKWQGMLSRARYKPKKSYDHVEVCQGWKEFMGFKKDMYQSYLRHKKKYGVRNTTLDRIDNAKGYSPENCRWATHKQQANNRTNNRTNNKKH